MRSPQEIILGPLVTEKMGRLAERAAASAAKRAHVAARRAARKAGKAPGAAAPPPAAAAGPETVRNVVAFRVARSANKLEIRHAVEALFNKDPDDKKVTVLAVRTLRCEGKMKRLGRFEGRRASWKKAYVTLGPGQTIPELQ
jgi:large subunit ribosomal protein L23